MSAEYRVLWRWRVDPDGPVEIFSPQRERVYKTLRGAERRLELLQKNAGRYECARDGDYGPVEVYQLDYARLEVRTVSDWVEP